MRELTLEDGCLLEEDDILKVLTPGTILKVISKETGLQRNVPIPEANPNPKRGLSSGQSIKEIKDSLAEIKRRRLDFMTASQQPSTSKCVKVASQVSDDSRNSLTQFLLPIYIT